MPELRITGGELGGRRIASPRRSGHVRPTTERVREAIFSILGDLGEARVLDLYCGTGALAIEALSRGAQQATLVDTRPELARENVESLDLSERSGPWHGQRGRAVVVRSDALAFLGRAPEGGFDLVLCDPPYELADRTSAQLAPQLRRVLAPGGRLMLETSVEQPLEVDLPLLRERRYGDTLVRVHAAEGEGPR